MLVRAFALSIGLLAVLVLAACGPERDNDGYHYEVTEFERATVTVTVVYHNTRQDLERAGEQAGVQINTIERQLAGFSVVDTKEARCTIHVIGYNNRVWLGHELLHCTNGRWHPTQP
jgi:hypothetical protein